MLSYSLSENFALFDTIRLAMRILLDVFHCFNDVWKRLLDLISYAKLNYLNIILFLWVNINAYFYLAMRFLVLYSK